MYKQLTRSLPIVAKVVGASMGVKVEFIPRLSAYTDHKVIALPNLKAIGSDEDAEVLEGMLDHEAGHVRFTQKHWTKMAHAQGPLFKSIYNIIEDGRIEKEQGRLYPGSRRNMSRMCEILRKLGFFVCPEQDDHPASLLSAALLYGLRHRSLGQAFCADWAPLAQAYAAQALGDALVQKALDLALDATRLDGSSEDAFQAARAIMTSLAQQEPQQDQAQDASDEQGDDQQQGRDDAEGSEITNGNESTDGGETTEADEDTEGQQATECTAPGQDTRDQGDQATAGNASVQSEERGAAMGSSSKETGSGACAERSEDTNGDEHTEGSETTDGVVDAENTGGGNTGPQHACPGEISPSSPESAQSVSETATRRSAAREQAQSASEDDIGAAGKDLGELIRDAAILDAGTEHAAEEERVLRPLAGMGGEATGLLIEQARQTTTSLALKLDDLLAARSMVDRRLARSGKLDTRRLAGIPVGNLQIFERAEESQAVDTAVFVLIDRSGSMAGEELRNAIQASVSFGLVADRNEVHVSGAMFGDHLLPLGDFGENWKKQVARISQSTDGGTAMGAAVSFAVSRLAAFHQAERKIILLVTDGAPNNFDSLEVAVKECAGLGIQSTAVLIAPHPGVVPEFSRIMPTGVACNPHDIPKAIFAALSDLL